MEAGLGLGADTGDLMDRIQAQVHAQISEQFREQVSRNAAIAKPRFIDRWSWNINLTCFFCSLRATPLIY
jgi:hypothetical protein